MDLIDVDPREALRARIRACLGELGLPPGGLLAAAEVAGALPGRGSTVEAEDFLLLSEGAGVLPRALRLLADACPEQGDRLRALALDWEQAPPSASATEQTSDALIAAWAALDSPWAWRWARANEPLQRAWRLLDGPLHDDPAASGARSLATHLDQLVTALPERLRATPGHALARHLTRWPALAGLIYTLGQGGRALLRAWPAAPWIIAFFLIAHAPRLALEPGADLRGYALGHAASDGHRLAMSALAPRASAPQLGEARPNPRSRPLQANHTGRSSTTPSRPTAPEDRTAQVPATPPRPDASPSSDAPSPPEPASQPDAQPVANEAGGGPLRGSGTIRHMALPDQAPMAFMGVAGLSPQATQPDDAELWVAQTEVTEAQWQALMRMDLTILTGQPDRPAEHMTFCEAMEYANRLSRHENLRPAYEIPRGCERGASVRWDRTANGYRLPTEAEWERLASDAPADGVTHRGAAYDEVEDAMGLYGLVGNAAELLWGPDGVPVARHRSCKAEALSNDLWPESAPLPCRQELSVSQRALGVGLRLVRPPS